MLAAHPSVAIVANFMPPRASAVRWRARVAGWLLDTPAVRQVVLSREAASADLCGFRG
jgi:hypothetical protein